MRWLLAGVTGTLTGVIYSLVFLSHAEIEPLAVFAVVGILAAAVDALISRNLARRNDGHVELAPRSTSRVVLRSAGVFTIVFLAALAVSVAFLLQMAP